MPDPATPTVVTTSGPVRGRSTSDGTVFLGVPYAAAPTGRHRFTAPRPHPQWTAVRDATTAGPTAPQPSRALFGALDMSPYFGPGWRRGDDYLTVNIWSPRRADKKLSPVMVFVHGGGFVAGSTSAPLYDGSAFARDGVVLVTVNYRLGVPGFLHLPDAPDNRGLLDVLAALRWIRVNAARFGGDPEAITLFGQSAGATIVGGVLANPDGLIRRAIVQSGTGTFTPEQAGIVTAEVGHALGVTPTARTLAEVSDDRFIGLLPRLATLDLATPTHHDPLGGITPFGLVLLDEPAVSVANGTAHDIDLLIGGNSEEGSLYLAPLGRLAETTDADLHTIAGRFHSRSDDLVRAYRTARPTATRAQLHVAILGDGLFGASIQRMAAAHESTGAATFRYEFTWRSDALDGQLGASHVMELPFVFDAVGLPSLHGPNALLGTTPPPSDLSHRVHTAWLRFATTGNPGWAPLRSGGVMAF